MNTGFRKGPVVKNFLFHRVNPQRDRLWDPMDVRLFEKCVQVISRNYAVLKVEDLVLNKERCVAGRRYASILFDDGYKDNMDFALPVLEKYGIKASFYVVTDCINNNIPTWTYILDFLFQYTAKTSLQIRFPFLPDSLHVSHLPNAQDRILYARRLKPFLKRLQHDERQVVLNHVRCAFDDVVIPRIMMNWDDLRQLAAAGHNVGSHTVTHSMLGTIKSEAEVLWELQQSGQTLAAELGSFPLAISYPLGSYNACTLRLARQSGYQMGLAVNQMAYAPSVHNDFEVPRIELYNEPWLKTRCRMSNTYRKLVKLLKPS